MLPRKKIETLLVCDPPPFRKTTHFSRNQISLSPSKISEQTFDRISLQATCHGVCDKLLPLRQESESVVLISNHSLANVLMESAFAGRELKRGAWRFFFVPPFSKALSGFQVSALAPFPSPFKTFLSYKCVFAQNECVCAVNAMYRTENASISAINPIHPKLIPLIKWDKLQVHDAFAGDASA